MALSAAATATRLVAQNKGREYHAVLAEMSDDEGIDYGREESISGSERGDEGDEGDEVRSESSGSDGEGDGDETSHRALDPTAPNRKRRGFRGGRANRDEMGTNEMDEAIETLESEQRADAEEREAKEQEGTQHIDRALHCTASPQQLTMLSKSLTTSPRCRHLCSLATVCNA